MASAQLTPHQRKLVGELTEALVQERDVTVLAGSMFTAKMIEELGDLLILHHVGSKGPFGKDKFEFAMERILQQAGRAAKREPGQRKRDLTVDGEGWSLKTQADANIKAETIHISKYMELGKGEWDIEVLRQQFVEHMKDYKHIFTLRCLSVGKSYAGPPGQIVYELVEIPMDQLAKAENEAIVHAENTKQATKPASVMVKGTAGDLILELYFDAGSERKLQVRKLARSACKVHATIKFKARQQPEPAESVSAAQP